MGLLIRETKGLGIDGWGGEFVGVMGLKGWFIMGLKGFWLFLNRDEALGNALLQRAATCTLTEPGSVNERMSGLFPPCR